MYVDGVKKVRVVALPLTMSRKRTSTETSGDEQTNEGSDSVLQQGNNAKRAKLASLYDTKLQDLPNELLYRILVKAVAMDLKAMELAKTAWKWKVDLIVSRLSTVCSQWSNILESKLFRKDVNSYLDQIAQEIRLEIVTVFWTQSSVLRVTTMKDEIFVLCKGQGQDYLINVYGRNNMAVVKDVIQLPDVGNPVSMVGCNVTQCIYVLNRKKYQHVSVLRITKEDEHQYTQSHFIEDLWQPNPLLAVTSTGSVILSRQQWALRARAVISWFNANGSLQQAVKLDSETSAFTQIIAKLNGNLVLVVDQERQHLTEIDMNGTVLSRYQHNGGCYKSISLADNCGRMVRTDRMNRIQLLDSEFNPLEFACAQLNGGSSLSLCTLHFDSERNEVVGVYASQNKCVVTLRFTKE